LHDTKRKDLDKAVEKVETKMIDKVDELKREHRANYPQQNNFDESQDFTRYNPN
jgi:16S rRNA C967 or C1407 C5-methylase (RsmB/RsmF family)